MSDDSFEALLHPLTLREFRERYWERLPVILEGNGDVGTALAFALDDFWDAVSTSASDATAVIRAQHVDASGCHRETAVGAGEARRAYEEGMTVCVKDIHLYASTLAEHLRALQTSDWTGKLAYNAYLSPPGKGFGLHFDDHSVIIHQIVGEKTWLWGSEPAVSAPPDNVVASDDAKVLELSRQLGSAIPIPEESSLKRHTLRPGDRLYLPSGTWHQTTACGVSLSLTLKASKAILSAPEAWRRSLPDAPEGFRSWLGEFLAERADRKAVSTEQELLRAWDREGPHGEGDVGASGTGGPRKR